MCYAGGKFVPQSPSLQLTLAGDKWTGHPLLSESVSCCCVIFGVACCALVIRETFRLSFLLWFLSSYSLFSFPITLFFSSSSSFYWISLIPLCRLRNAKQKHGNTNRLFQRRPFVRPVVFLVVGFLFHNPHPSWLWLPSFHLLQTPLPPLSLLRLHCWRDPLFRIPVGEEKQKVYRIRNWILMARTMLTTNEMKNTLFWLPSTLSLSLSLSLSFFLSFSLISALFHLAFVCVCECAV